MKIEYSSNNSGGNWPLSDKNWYDLENAGWEVEWVKNQKKRGDFSFTDKCGTRWLGALATKATKDFETPAEAMKEFEKITGQDVMDEGCGCCGPYHSFSWTKKGDGWGYASGETCGQYLFEDLGELTLREALEKLKEETKK